MIIKFCKNYSDLEHITLLEGAGCVLFFLKVEKSYNFKLWCLNLHKVTERRFLVNSKNMGLCQYIPSFNLANTFIVLLRHIYLRQFSIYSRADMYNCNKQ